MWNMETTNSGRAEAPVAVVGRGGTLTAGLLRRLLPGPVVEFTPCQAALYEGDCRAVVVENFDPAAGRTLSGCAVARWALSQRSGVTVVGLDDPEGQRCAGAMPGAVYAYSDGRPQADLTAKNVRLRGERLEFEAFTTRGELMRVRVPANGRPRLYDHLAALAGALALGVPLGDAVARLNG